MRPSPERPSGASSEDGSWSATDWPPPCSTDLSCKLFSDGLLAPGAEPIVRERERTRLPSQNASNNPSNLSQSDLRAENRCLNAARSEFGRAA